MKKDIHPESLECSVTCACGNKFSIYSTQTSMKLDICNACHPFFTGEEKLVDTDGRVDKFNKRYSK